MQPFEDGLLAASRSSVLLNAARRVTSMKLIEQYIPHQNIVSVKTENLEGANMVQSD